MDLGITKKIMVERGIVAGILMAVSTVAFSISIGSDTTPDPFSFEDKVDVKLGMPVVSAPVTISGIDMPATITVVGGEYSVGCTGTWTKTNGTISNDQWVCVRHNASLSSSVTTNTTLTIGGISDTFSSTTETIVIVAPDGDPDPFEIPGLDGVMPGVTVTSIAIKLVGFDVALPISTKNGDLDIGCDGVLDITPAGNQLYVEAGATVCVSHVSAIRCGETVTSTLKVGHVSSTFSTTTQSSTEGCFNNSGDGGGSFAPITLFSLLSILFGRKGTGRLPVRRSSVSAANHSLKADGADAPRL
jgi:hypothetical protein